MLEVGRRSLMPQTPGHLTTACTLRGIMDKLKYRLAIICVGCRRYRPSSSPHHRRPLAPLRHTPRPTTSGRLARGLRRTTAPGTFQVWTAPHIALLRAARSASRRARRYACFALPPSLDTPCAAPPCSTAPVGSKTGSAYWL